MPNRNSGVNEQYLLVVGLSTKKIRETVCFIFPRRPMFYFSKNNPNSVHMTKVQKMDHEAWYHNFSENIKVSLSQGQPSSYPYWVIEVSGGHSRLGMLLLLLLLLFILYILSDGFNCKKKISVLQVWNEYLGAEAFQQWVPVPQTGLLWNLQINESSQPDEYKRQIVSYLCFKM